MAEKISVFWFRQDLRLSDNPGLTAASKKGIVMPIYILAPEKQEQYCNIGAASKWWLHHSLVQLNASLDNKLNIYVGEPSKILLQLLQQYPHISAVYWNNRYEPAELKADNSLKQRLLDFNLDCQSYNAALLWQPWDILKSDGNPYRVYTHFYRNGCLKFEPPRSPLPAPRNMQLFASKADLSTKVVTIDDLGLLPKINWDKHMIKVWKIGEQAAQQRLADFLAHGLQHYKENRNYPSLGNVSRLSPHLHFGEISPHQVWHAAKKSMELNHDLDHFLSELGWREFSYYLLHHFPELPKRNFQPKFDYFPWKRNKKWLIAWQQGKTGYPLVDAGMRELWQTGYIHNRVRMVVGSFLVKNLLLDWRLGEEWFWDCLVDADLANNSASWQWVAGSGADAAPYFRIFNPVTQGEKFDPQGIYTKRFVPELAKLPDKYLFQPWAATAEILATAGVTLGITYPKPIVQLELSRNQALEAYKQLPKATD